MALPVTAQPAPFDITRASHAILTVRDLAAAEAFYTEVIGLAVSDREPGALYLRGLWEACHHSLVLKVSPKPGQCERAGFRVAEEEDLDKAKAYFDRMGIPCAFAEVPFQGPTLHVSDPVGTRLEFCAHQQVLPRLALEYASYRGGEAKQLDHLQVLAPDVTKAVAFYTALGFRISEYVPIPGEDGFIFCAMQRKGSPNDMVFAAGPGPVLHQVAYMVGDASRILRACDCAGVMGQGSAVEFGPGRHGPAYSNFAYLRDPDGHRIELFDVHYQVIDRELEPLRWGPNMKRPEYGLPAQRSWTDQGSAFIGVPVGPLANEKARRMVLEDFLLKHPSR